MIVSSLLLPEIPKELQYFIENYPEKSPSTYRYKWMIRLPVHYNAMRYVQEVYNSFCLDGFIGDTKYECLKPL